MRVIDFTKLRTGYVNAAKTWVTWHNGIIESWRVAQSLSKCEEYEKEEGAP